ncbi:NAD-dependent epimerase/dehydratase family protein [Rhizobium sp. 42MFCr.1]|uniref:NAD-dependent epimerase/dehydratase family protein n=1 Tax=Rhizobium sp. 42MFCr.1 TaxID=1048680 RepID=UPI001FD9D0F6|nr:NAD-dependent epimerase/dehydratase family protein [Rhizobium sp. 42MFCr.1]
MLITGGWGSLGRSLAMQLRSVGHHVVQAGRSSVHAEDSVCIDVCNYDDLSGAINSLRPEIVVHLSAVFSDDFALALATNVIGAKNLLAALEENHLNARVLLAGSAAEYGIVHPEENPISVEQVLRPVSIYGVTKAWQTQWGVFCAHKGQDVIVARIFNLVGKGMSERLFVGRVYKQLEHLAAGSRDRIETGPLAAVRDYISLEEAGKQLMAIMQTGKSGSIYNVASGKPVSMRELLQGILRERGLGMDIVVEGARPHGRTGFDVPIIYADVEQTIALMGVE